MRIGFINPGNEHNFKQFKIGTPLGALYLLTILEEKFGKNIDLELVDLRGLNDEDKPYRVHEKDLFLYSITSPEWCQIKRLSSRIKDIYPKSKHVAGGPHVEIFPDETSQAFDAISLGDGEESVKQIVEDVSNGVLKKVYKQKEKLDLKNYPFPSRKYLPKLSVADKGMISYKFPDLVGTLALFSRGCPFNCHFCANITRGKVYLRSSEAITEEIEYLKRDYGIEALVIKDDQAIHTNPAIAQSMLEAIAKTGVTWRGQSRANGIRPDMLKLAKRSGCEEIAVGIESVDERVLKIINKGINLDKARDYIQLLRENEISVKLLLMMGLPGEPKDIAEKTIEYITNVNPSSVLLSLFCPMPGSEIYRNMYKFGIKLDETISFDKYFTSFARFDPNEKPLMVFSYEEKTPFGRGRTNEEITDSYLKVQTFLRTNKLNF